MAKFWRPGQTRRGQAGLSLVEVLVTLVVVALGLLGIAGLQVSALKLGFIAENRSNGVVLANNIVDRMRANIANASAYATSFGSAAPTGTSQAEKDLADFRTQIANSLPEGDAEIKVAQSAAADCEAPAIAKCWDVTVSLRWNEANVQGGKSGSAQSFMKIASRI